MVAVKAKPQSINSHLAGEYFVAAELHKRGYTVALTIGNAKAVDLIVEHERKTICIQVKAIQQRKSVGWPILRSKVLPKVVYVFICLNENEEPPTYFLALPGEIRSKIKEYKTSDGQKRGIINYGQIDNDKFKNQWPKIDKALKKFGGI
jgi:hypothetical protein